MTDTHPVLHTLHNVGIAAWAGGSLMGAVGLNGAASSLDDPRQRATAATRGWRRWAPVNAAALGAHLVGATGLLITDRGRVKHQKGVGRSTAIKTVATGAGLGVAAWSALLNQKMTKALPVAVDGATEPGPLTPPDVAQTQKQLKIAQWANPAVAFSLVALSSWHAEQQRTAQVAQGGLAKLADRAPLPVPALAGGAVLLTALAARRRQRRQPEVWTETVEVVEVGVVDLDAPVDARRDSQPASASTFAQPVGTSTFN